MIIICITKLGSFSSFTLSENNDFPAAKFYTSAPKMQHLEFIQTFLRLYTSARGRGSLGDVA